MSSQQGNVQIPIALTAIPTEVGVAPANFNQLLALIASNMTGFISASVSFFSQGTVTPSAFVSALFYNVSQNMFYGWSTTNGEYLALTPFIQGDCKYTYVGGDAPNQGWIILNGRAITSIPGISAKQLSVLQSLFGATANLPNVTPIQSLTGLPGSGSFSDILNPAVAPATGQFAGLTVNSPPQQSDLQATNQNAETLDASVQAVQQAVASIITQSEAVLDSLNGTSGAALYAAVFCGFP